MAPHPSRLVALWGEKNTTKVQAMLRNVVFGHRGWSPSQKISRVEVLQPLTAIGQSPLGALFWFR